MEQTTASDIVLVHKAAANTYLPLLSILIPLPMS